MLPRLFESLAIVLALVAAALWLRQRDVLTETGGQTLSRITTDLILPALVFASLSRLELPLEHLPPALIMLTATLLMLPIAWFIARWLELDSAQTGAFILVAGIGSSSTLGYSLIGQVFSGNTEASADAVLISELGAVLPLYLVGVPIAMYFGNRAKSRTSLPGELVDFLRSPVFIALIAGLGVSAIGLPESTIVRTLYRGLDLLGSALPVFVVLAIGSMLRRIPVAVIGVPVLLVLILKLLIEPLLVVGLAESGEIKGLHHDILLIEAAMPSGMLAAIVAARYGCDGGFASMVVVLSSIASLVSVPLVYGLLT